MARGEEKDLKALWEVTEELWGVEGEMVFQNLSQLINLPQPFRTFLKTFPLSTFPNVGGMIWQRWRSGRAEEGWRHLQVRDGIS